MSTIDEKINVKVEWDNEALRQNVEDIKTSIRSLSDIRIEPLPPIIDTEAYSWLFGKMLNVDEINQMASDLADETCEILEVAMAEALSNITILEGNQLIDPKTVERAKKAITGLTEELKSSAGKTDDSKKKWENLNKAFANSGSIFTELGSQIPGITGKIFKGIGNISTAAGTMVQSIGGIRKEMSALEKSCAILAAISAAIKAVSFISDIVKANKEANEASAKANREYADSIEEVTRAATRDRFDSIFGKDSFGTFKINAAIAQAELANIEGWLLKIQGMQKTYKPGDEQKLSSWDALFQTKRMKKFTESQFDGIVSDMRSGWQKFWNSGKKNIHTITYEDMLGIDGKFDGEKLRTWYEAYGDGVSKENKKLIEGLLADWDDYKAAMDSMKDYLADIFSDTASTIADKMIEAFIKTGNAVTDLTDLTRNLAKALAKNSIIEYLTSVIFDEKFKEDITNALKDDDISTATKLFSNKLNVVENWIATSGNDLLKSIFGLSNPDGTTGIEIQRNSEAKGIAQASQESVSELNGRMTVMQEHTYSLMENTKILVDNSASMLERLCNIDFNTARLSAIEKDMHNVSSFVNQISVQGVKIAL